MPFAPSDKVTLHFRAVELEDLVRRFRAAGKFGFADEAAAKARVLRYQAASAPPPPPPSRPAWDPGW